MKYLLLGIHNHQPVGNFEHVFEHAFQHSYKPFIEVLEHYPEFKFAVHNTGPLWEFFERKHPDFIDKIGRMVERGQVELVISGFYEPVLASIPHRDRVGQIEKAVEYVKKRFGVKPVGLWLTERVWESEILPSLLESGIKYVMVDDFHFLSAGKRKEELHGYYLTEWEGKTLAIFPIDETLRYLIPFRAMEEGINYIKNIPGNLAIIFDDGEKFGVWPGTYHWVYEEKWLVRFVESVLSQGDIKTLTYSEALKKFPPLGRIYLPTASYFEMGEWSLPPDGAVDFIEFVEKLRREGVFDRYRRFVRGGIWRNFLVKYEESNNMHKKMLYLSEVIKGRRDTKLRELLYKAQCNDAYWHGVFGGLYLPHLRKEIYRNLVELDGKVKTPSLEVEDFNKDGRKEISLKNRYFRISIMPHVGGSIYEISHYPSRYNFQDTLTRRFEHYHKGVQVGQKPEKGVASIHELGKWVSEESAKEMVYDNYPRYSFYIHLLPLEINLEDIRYNRYEELGDFTTSEYTYKVFKNRVVLRRKSELNGIGAKVSVRKVLELRKDLLWFEWALKSDRELENIVALEFNLKFEVPKVKVGGEWQEASRRDYHIKGQRKVSFYDEVLGITLSLETGNVEEFYIFPILTVSQSESGFDLVYQGNSILLLGRVSGKSFRDSVILRISGGKLDND